MAESAVSYLVEKLGALLENEVRLLSGVQGDFEEVRDELEGMKAFLREADATEDIDEGVKAWVKQVRDLAYNAEDVIDKFLFRFEQPRQPGVFGRLAKIARALSTLEARRQVAFELRKIKSEAVKISERRQRYPHNWSSTQIDSGSDTRSLLEMRKNARLVPAKRMVGIESRKVELLSCLLEDNEESHGAKVIAVEGMGGLGKTTLVSQIYGDARVKEIFKRRAWITVSQSFDERELLLKIIKQLLKTIEQPIPEETYSKDVHSLKQDIQSFLQERKYLIVLDDVWNTNAWESLKYAFPDNNFGSRLIVTTRIRNVANIVTRDPFQGKIYTLTPLTWDESWNLFSARVFQGQPCPQHLLGDSQIILEKCKGLPLAIVSVCSLLASRNASTDEWRTVRQSLEGEIYGNNQIGDMEKILLLNFNDLPYHLKSCVLYLSLFPEDWKCKKQYMISLWTAEGFVKQRGNVSPEEIGDIYFSELLSRSLIQASQEADIVEGYRHFQVHDVVREILLRKSHNQSFAATINERNLSVPEKVRRLSVNTSLEKLEGCRDFSTLRSLIFASSSGSIHSSISMSKFLVERKVRLLKVLDCSRLANMETFPKFITTQYNLRYLNLSSTNVRSIPHSIKWLRNLETLNLLDTLVEELPAEILQIHGLRHLLAYRRNVEGSFKNRIGVRVPTGIETLTTLQTLLVIQGSSDLIGSLGKLKQLKDLRIEQVREEHGAMLCSSIEQMSHLRVLNLGSMNENILDVQNLTCPPSNLKELTINGQLMKLPKWISSKLESLVFLSIKWSMLTVDPLETLKYLPNLVYLEFFDKAYDGEELCFRAGGFKMLRKLWFENLERLKRVTVEEGATPRLETFMLRDCKSLEDMPSGIEFLTNIRKLSFMKMGDVFVKRLRSSSEDSDFHRIKHVLSFFTGSLNADGDCDLIFEKQAWENERNLWSRIHRNNEPMINKKGDYATPKHNSTSLSETFPRESRS